MNVLISQDVPQWILVNSSQVSKRAWSPLSSHLVTGTSLRLRPSSGCRWPESCFSHLTPSFAAWSVPLTSLDCISGWAQSRDPGPSSSPLSHLCFLPTGKWTVCARSLPPILAWSSASASAAATRRNYLKATVIIALIGHHVLVPKLWLNALLGHHILVPNTLSSHHSSCRDRWLLQDLSLDSFVSLSSISSCSQEWPHHSGYSSPVVWSHIDCLWALQNTL